eukprot:7522635-Pyramimonas_sp.AAC.1
MKRRGNSVITRAGNGGDINDIMSKVAQLSNITSEYAAASRGRTVQLMVEPTFRTVYNMDGNSKPAPVAPPKPTSGIDFTFPYRSSSTIFQHPALAQKLAESDRSEGC